MTGERSYAVLPCANMDSALEFFSALGFTMTFSQHRPNPYAVVAPGDLQVHLAEIEGFDPTSSYASVIITVTELEKLRAKFAAGLRNRFGRVPMKGIPRILPVRRKAGTATGFSVVDVGGNWLRFYRSIAEEEPFDDMRSGLGRVIDVAARQGDARGDDRQAIVVLDAGLVRYPDASALELFEAITYRAELRLRMGVDAEVDLARASALAEEHLLGEPAQNRLSELRSNQ